MLKIAVINLLNLFIPYLIVFIIGPYLNYSFDFFWIFCYMVISPIIINATVFIRTKKYKLPFLFLILDYVFFFFFSQYLISEILKNVRFF